MENKSLALAHLKVLINQCSRETIEDLSIDKEEKTVTVTCTGGYQFYVNVNADSCIAMVKDICTAMIREM